MNDEVNEVLSGGERTISPGGGMEQRPDWRPYLQESSGGLREAVRDVLEGTPLDRHGNRNDDGMRMHLTMKWDGGTAPVREWFARLDAALRAEEESHE